MAHTGLDAIAYRAGYNDGRLQRGNRNPYDQATLLSTWSAYEEGYADGSLTAQGGTTLIPGPQGPAGPPGPQGPPGAADADGVNIIAAGTQTAGNTQTVLFQNSNGVSFGMSGSNVVTASVAGIKSVSAGTTRLTNGELVLSNANGVSFGVNGNTVTASVGVGGVGSLSAGTTRATLGEVVLSNSNGVSFGMAGQTLTGSVAAQVPFGVSAGTQSVSTGTLVFSNSNGITFGMSGSSRITASHNGLTTAALSDHSHGNPQLNLTNLSGTTASNSAGFTLSLSAAAGGGGGVGLSAGTQSVSTGTVVFSNSNGITFGMSGSSRITASHNGLTTAAQSDHSHGNPTLALTNLSGTTASNSAGLTLSLSAAPPSNTIGMSAGTQSVGTGTVVFSNSNGISFGMSDSSRITASYTVPTITSLSLSDQATSITAARLAFTNLNGVTLSLSTTTGGSATLVGSHNALTSQSNQALSGSNGSFAFQTATFGNLNGLSFYTSNGSMVGSYTVPTQSAQTLGLYGSSNTTGQSSSSTFDARSVTFRGAGVASVGMSGGEVVISVPSGGGAGDGGNVLAAGTQTGTSLGTIRFEDSNGISFGMSGSTRITASYTVPSTAGLLSNIRVSAGTTSNLLSAVTLGDANNVSFGLNASTLTASIPAGATATGNLGAVGGGTQTATSGTVVFADSNGISFGLSGSTRMTATVRTDYANSTHSHGNPTLNLTNLSGTTASNSAGLTLSLSAAAQSVQPGVGSISAGTTRVTTGEAVFADGNGISFGVNGQTITASHNGLTSQSNQNVTAANGGFAFQTLSFSNANGVSFGTSAGSAITGSVAAGATATGNVGAISAAGASASAGTIVFSNSNNVSFGMAGSTVTATITVPAQTVDTAGLYAVGQTTGQSSSTTRDIRSLSVQGAGGVSVGYSAGSLVISGAAGGGAGYSAGLSNIGNTLGNTGTVSQQLVLAGGNNITLSGSVNGGSATITISAGAGGGGNFSAGVSTAGNTAGSTGVTGTRLVLAGVGAVSLSQSTDANGGTVSITSPATSSLAATGALSFSSNGSTISLGVGQLTAYAAGNTSGSSSGTLDARSLSFHGSNGITVNVSNGSVVFSGGGGGGGGGTTYGSTQVLNNDNLVTHAIQNASLQLFPIYGVPNLTFNRCEQQVLLSCATNSTCSLTLSALVGFYTRNGTAFSLLSSSSTSFALTLSGTANSTLYSGQRIFGFNWNCTLPPGDYVVGQILRSTTGGNNATVSVLAGSAVASNFSGYLGSATNNTYLRRPGLGFFSNTTTALPSSIAFSHITGTASQAIRLPSLTFFGS